ncbi:MAG: hypothetical protein LBV59_16080 [Sphingobacterium sp.]|jgi:hypothetical protein|uniref:hypothetical protein n=1 Tax=Sphingobacterium sp. TaxID=341027 RepID=UPI0028462731|nr:hypothetical protein [Sphingobacterium sp.]MDR3009453.1 hypothetical protein [Sphingobacterium sp.]
MEKETNQQDFTLHEQQILVNSGTGIRTELGKAVKSFIKFASLAIAAFGLTFHMMPDHGYRIFPKERLSFAYTVIASTDVDHMINRYNEATDMERMLIQQEYIYQRLEELGVIVSKEEGGE